MSYSEIIFDVRNNAINDIKKYIEAKGETTIKNSELTYRLQISIVKGILCLNNFDLSNIDTIDLALIADMLNKMS